MLVFPFLEVRKNLNSKESSCNFFTIFVPSIDFTEHEQFA